MTKQHTHALAKASVTSLKALTDDNAGALHPDDSSKWPVSQDRKLGGMIHKNNPDWEMGGHGHDTKAWKVGQIMSDEVVFCYEGEECERAERLMEEHGMNYLAVVDREMRIVGIFCREEIQALSHATASGAAAADALP